MITHQFINRHNGPRRHDVETMLASLGLNTLDELIVKTVPSDIYQTDGLSHRAPMTEHAYLNHIRSVAKKNKVFKTYIGQGYYGTVVPPVILRNVFENPGWYTSYTPYQAEISQGRLEALLTYQTMIADMTGMPIANASLLDEGTAAAEAMLMLHGSRSRAQVKAGANTFLVSTAVYPQTIEVLKTRASQKGIELRFSNREDFLFDEGVFGCLVQYPDEKGEVYDFRDLIARAHEREVPVAVGADLLSLALLTPPGEWGADVVFGSAQRMGVPMGFGGPHAAFFATTENYKRSIPGRIIGISKDKNGNDALRMALQTREQHIKREKATSNICTAQALLAIMSGMYAVYHGQQGIREIATHVHGLAVDLAASLEKLGYQQLNKNFFDTLYLQLPEGVAADGLREVAVQHGVNLRYFDDGRHVGISLDETTSAEDVALLSAIMASAAAKDTFAFEITAAEENRTAYLPESMIRTSAYLEHPVFNTYHSETEMMRYLKSLENKDLALNRTMIPLGSCTMKLNAVAELMPISWPEFTDIHPFVPAEQAAGYMEVIHDMNTMLSEATGFASVSFQPNSGAAGEYTGLLVIKAYQDSIGQAQRNICLIPASAHGTNPASAVMAGMEVVVVKTAPNGNIDMDDLKAKVEQHSDALSAIMVTYPSTHGVFEESIREVVSLIHQHGGQVYMDGANMNAQVGITSPGHIGADVCHLNLHKTFAIPHGGGGPGVGPIGVASHLVPFLPGHIYQKTGGEQGIPAVAAAPYGSALVLLISYGYMKMLGSQGLIDATKMAILNANYMMNALKDDYPILYRGVNGFVGHEMILDCNQFSKSADITVVDIAKRLMDYGFHAPTVAFPVHGTLMVEPTESEPLSEMNFFIEAMKSIRQEIRDIEEGRAEKKNNVVVNAPHTAEMVIANEWLMPYDRESAAFPLSWVRANKYFTTVAKIDDAYGDRNLCACLPVSAYEEQPVLTNIKEI